jgi:hypothetical protein
VGLAMEDVSLLYGHLTILRPFGIFYGHLVYLFVGCLVYFSRYKEKSGNPGSEGSFLKDGM